MKLASNFAYISKRSIALFKNEKASNSLKKQIYAEDQELSKKLLGIQLASIEEQIKELEKETSAEEIDSDDLKEELQSHEFAQINKGKNKTMIKSQSASRVGDIDNKQSFKQQNQYNLSQTKKSSNFPTQIAKQLPPLQTKDMPRKSLLQLLQSPAHQQLVDKKLQKLEEIRKSELKQYNQIAQMNSGYLDDLTKQNTKSNIFAARHSPKQNSIQSLQTATSSQQNHQFIQEKVKISNQRNPKKYKEKVDTNIIHLNLQTIKDIRNLKNDKPIYCEQCKAVLNKYCDISKEQERLIWKCSFCFKVNTSEPGAQIQSNLNTTYCLDDLNKNGIQDKNNLDEDITIIFCIDISGSMAEICNRNGHAKISVIQLALIEQIQEMAMKFPKRKVGLVTFSDDIQILGNHSTKSVVLSEEYIDNSKMIIRQSKKSYQGLMDNILANSYNDLIDKIINMMPTANTALGPGLLASIALASQGKKGSQVLLCTDGVSNVGLGNLLGNYNQALDFYHKVAQYARQKDVTTHIVTFNTGECGIGALLPVADQTGGAIERVGGDNLSANFKEIISKPIIATKAKIRLHLLQCFKFNREERDNLRNGETTFSKVIGNVVQDTEFTFEFGLRKIKSLVEREGISIDQLKKLPYQLIIEYVGLDGKQYVKIITNQAEISSDRIAVETQADVDILALNSIQQSSKLARMGDYKNAQILAKASYNSISKTVSYTGDYQKLLDYQASLTPVYNTIQKISSVTPKVTSLIELTRTNDHHSQELYSASKMNSLSYKAPHRS
ncbi:type a von willebrand factor domain-containing protein [Stylonychia lemnae]|uniref:Type a von willebrand factor domain-containing protein n=1 Tax=Stylonychia lemnae TaxID=5949 RepID=A0A078AQA1_STYLE|nr:type a von willebrand factor domain-containing protein [Stylonychia lemnae]|eukprot:CDW84580.1 type a von willebrand factor domain-containing protein [Stylonychia lemnae]